MVEGQEGVANSGVWSGLSSGKFCPQIARSEGKSVAAPCRIHAYCTVLIEDLPLGRASPATPGGHFVSLILV